MKAQSKVQSDCDVKVAIDKGSIRLSFPKRHSPLWELMDGKSLKKGKPKYLYLGKAGFSASDPSDIRRAELIAAQMESDLDHPEWEKLFDRTLEKYGLAGLLGGKYAKLADVLQMPGTPQAVPEITVGEMWEDYLEWKQSQVEPTTFLSTYRTKYTNIIKGQKWNQKTQSFDDTGLGVFQMIVGQESAEHLLKASFSKNIIIGCALALNEAFTRASQLGKFRLPDINPFFELHKKVGDNAKERYKPTITDNGEVIEWWQIEDAKEDELENDRRAFTKEERETIIQAFYESSNDTCHQIAPLIEFLFLTGCRPGEAFALRWQDVMLDRGVIRFSKSYASRNKLTKRTKTKEIRIFPLTSRLIALLTQCKGVSKTPTALVFTQLQGQTWNNSRHSDVWVGYSSRGKYYPGVVTKLVEQGLISGYLPPYHTRHTYITLTAHACQSNSSMLVLLAHACGNSVEVIMKHYLDIDRSVKLPDI